MSKKRKNTSGKNRQNTFIMGAIAGAVVTYILYAQQQPGGIVVVKGGGTTVPPILTQPGDVLGLPPQPLTIQRMSATYIP